MESREAKLLADIKRVACPALSKEVTALKRKLKAMTESRDHYRETARRYQKQLIEERTSVYNVRNTTKERA